MTEKEISYRNGPFRRSRGQKSMFGLGYVPGVCFGVRLGVCFGVCFEYGALDDRNVVGLCFEVCIEVCSGYVSEGSNMLLFMNS